MVLVQFSTVYLALLVFNCMLDKMPIKLNKILPEEYPAVTNKPQRRRSIVALMFLSVSHLNVTSKPQPSCKWLRGYKLQNQICRNRRGLPEVLLQARNLAINNCRKLFEFDRWNCFFDKSTFRKAFRETAFLHAISGSALVYSIAKACSDGRIQNCQCGQQGEVVNVGQQWKWGGCSDNVKQASKITKNFLQQKQKGDTTTNILNYNSLIGIKTVVETVIENCKCHGLSASCIMKTCWKNVLPFSQTAANLKQNYHNAAIHLSKNTVEQSISKINTSPYKLLYLVQSSKYCFSTVGRRCKSIENCATLCCGRGFRTSFIQVKKQCRCRWSDCCYEVTCDTCNEDETVFICK